ncbi:hypothetical protein Poli38472_003996 [Pythium oligandrum]|uniref:Uncharacterized protein n=1 Tax=Pythium oligandrum TaxID=41045 RepID=A0A8K1CM93_PYTOL|nr:hypothetical protein Poli38472_003996 [Pythium oligandrum]|eukprot:TMW66231.1 hypothetical protein Poli38472_003996 [Pythium oligandrum]
MEYRVRKRNIKSTGFSERTAEEIFSDALVRRFHARAGFTTTSARAVEHTRDFYSDFMRKLVDATVVLMQHSGRNSIRLTDVLRACKHYGIRLYGYDDMCVIEGPWGIEELHVTEMVEAKTTFGRDRECDDEPEPDMEPEYYKKTDFAQNQAAWADDEDEDADEASDDEWSWYGDSDADSDGEEDEDMDTDIHSSTRWQVQETSNEKLMSSLRAAQDAVDNELLIQEAALHVDENDAPMGQGYVSDCDNHRELSYMPTWKIAVEEEDNKWMVHENMLVMENEDGLADTEDMEVDEQTGDSEVDVAVNDYLIARQVFKEMVHSFFSWSLDMSAVALSALHNVSEQYLSSCLTSGALRSQLVTILMEERLKNDATKEKERQEERAKLQEAQQRMVEMQSAFKSKELDMQQRIAELEHQLRQYQQGIRTDGEPTDQTPRKRQSPGKRKASDKDPAKKVSGASSIVGSLRNRLHDYRLRKKSKINPV